MPELHEREGRREGGREGGSEGGREGSAFWAPPAQRAPLAFWAHSQPRAPPRLARTHLRLPPARPSPCPRRALGLPPTAASPKLAEQRRRNPAVLREPPAPCPPARARASRVPHAGLRELGGLDRRHRFTAGTSRSEVLSFVPPGPALGQCAPEAASIQVQRGGGPPKHGKPEGMQMTVRRRWPRPAPAPPRAS